MNIHAFWQKNGLLQYLLYPLVWLWAFGTFIRKFFSKPYRSKLFVICLGNLNLGGSGKTPTAIKVAKMFKNKGLKVAFLTKGYGGRLNEPTWVKHEGLAIDFGDEALLLANVLPTMVSKKLDVGLKAIEKQDFDIVIIDDGLQNPNIIRDYNILVVNGNYGFGNRKLFPSGPLREPLASGLQKADVVIVLEEDTYGVCNLVESFSKKVFKGYYKAATAANVPSKVFAFCGIGIPDKFIKTLNQNGIVVEKFKFYKDHYYYSDLDLDNLVLEAKKYNLQLITTEKDYTKISAKYKKHIIFLKIDAIIQEEDVLESLIMQKINFH